MAEIKTAYGREPDAACKKLLRRFLKSLEGGEADWDALEALIERCGGKVVREAGAALAKSLASSAMQEAWRSFKNAEMSGGDLAAAYAEAVTAVWNTWDLFNTGCEPAAVMARYIAEASARYPWPARWPFIAAPTAAIRGAGCDLPDEAAETLGPDEWARLESFLEDGAGSVEVTPDRKVELVWDGRHIDIVVPPAGT